MADPPAQDAVVPEALHRIYRAHRALSSCNQAMVRAAKEAELLAEVCRIVVDIAGYRLCWVGYAEDDEARTVRPVAQAGYEEGYLQTVRVTWADTERGRGPAGTPIRTHRPCIVRDAATDPDFAPWRDEALKRGYASVLGLPLMAPPGLVGVVVIYAAEPDAFDDEEVRLLGALADDLTYGIMALRTRAEAGRAETALRQAHEELEQRVAERTAELAHANRLLQEEVAERRRTEQELARARDAAEGASQAKTTFLASVSHEIRTPMNAILGMTELALATPLTTEQREYLQLAHLSAEGLLNIINDILDFSRMEAHKLHLVYEPFALRESLQVVTKALALTAQKKGLGLSSAVSADVPDGLVGDAGRLRQVLMNLIGNALKFTEQGEVGLRVEMGQRRNGDVVVHFAVSDTGPGIPAAKQALLFQPFSQVDSSLSRKQGGTGLGLAICAQLVALMDGSIDVDSVEGQGSTFHFTARFGLATAPIRARPAALAPQALASRRLRVLLAEDNPVNQKLAVALLQKQGHSVNVATNGHEALALLPQQEFDLVLMDVQMPELDGLETTRRIRAREEGTGRHVPILAMTAYAMPGDRQRCLAAGMDGYLSKPIRSQELYAALAGVLPDPETLAPEVAPVPNEQLNRAAALEQVGGDARLLGELAGIFLEHYPGWMQDLRQAIAAGNATAVRRIGHTLKGALVQLGATAACDEASKAEASASSGDMPAAEEARARLEATLERLRPALEAWRPS